LSINDYRVFCDRHGRISLLAAQLLLACPEKVIFGDVFSEFLLNKYEY
jgi:hypothetical protein